eukprot:3156575-Pyramimonas_sp.AAC.1
MLCDWGVPHARSDELQQQGGVQKVERVPVEWLFLVCVWVTLRGVACLPLTLVVAPWVSQPVASDAASSSGVSEHPGAAKIASLGRAEEVPQQ